MTGPPPGTTRKDAERHLHDHLRGTHAHDPHYTSNKRWYSIDKANVDFVHGWLRSRVRGKAVLDFCCGDGRQTVWLAQAGARAVGIDISAVSVDNGRATAAALGLTPAQAEFRVMDAEAMEFPDSTFDFVLISGVLHHLDLQRAYAEIARVLTPTGSAIATEALKHNRLISAYRRRTPHLRSDWETAHILGREEIAQARAFFDDVRLERFFHLTSIAAVPLRASRFFTPVLGTLRALDTVLLKVPGLRWQAWMVVFTLSGPRKSGTKAMRDHA